MAGANGGAANDDATGPAPPLAPGARPISGVGALAVTGVIGRIQRNHGQLLAIALGLVVLGAALWAAAVLLDKGLGQRLCKFGGLLATAAGIIVGFVAAITSAGETEQPTVSVKLDRANLRLT